MPEDDKREGSTECDIYLRCTVPWRTDFALRNKLTIIAFVKLDELLGALIRG